MAVRAGRNLIGDYLMKTGEITREQLDEALRVQEEYQRQGKKSLLGNILIEMGFTTESAMTRAIARRVGVTYFSLEERPIDKTAMNMIDPDTARRYRALPVALEGDRLVVAMMHPTDVIAMDDLRILTGRPIKPVMIPDSELSAAMEQFFRDASGIEEAEEEDPDEMLPPGEGEERPAVQLANQIINQAVQSLASDVHIEPQEKNLRVRFRIDGVLHEVMQQPRRLYSSLVSRIKVMTNMNIAERRVPQDGRVTLKVEGKTIDIRAASLPAAYGEKLTLRILDRSARLITLEELGFPGGPLEKYQKALKLPYGFILVTGPTGSGKSTTLYASLVELNQVDKHIVTLEDPVERRLDGVNQVQVNLKAGMTFASGLRSILRNDPDIVMIGEIRDHETARIAVESSLTGHLVLSTLHTNDAAGAVTRLGDMGIEPYLTASSLAAVVAQRLVRLLCTHCKEPYRVTRREILASAPDFPLEEGKDALAIYRPKGCIRCSYTGYRGRRGIYELLLTSENLQRIILEQGSTQDIKKAAVEEGMVTLRQDGLHKVKEGLTSLEEILRLVI